MEQSAHFPKESQQQQSNATKLSVGISGKTCAMTTCVFFVVVVVGVGGIVYVCLCLCLCAFPCCRFFGVLEQLT